MIFKLCTYSFGSLPVGAVFHSHGQLCFKDSVDTCCYVIVCECGKRVLHMIREIPMRDPSEMVDAECVGD